MTETTETYKVIFRNYNDNKYKAKVWSAPDVSERLLNKTQHEAIQSILIFNFPTDDLPVGTTFKVTLTTPD